MASRNPEHLHPNLQPIFTRFMAACAQAGLNILVTCTWRSNEEQNELYAQGRTKPGKIVTRARAGQSAHNYTVGGKPASKAFDIVPLVNGKPCWDAKNEAWAKAGKIGMDLGLLWYGRPGAPFKEFPHFQLKE